MPPQSPIRRRGAPLFDALPFAWTVTKNRVGAELSYFLSGIEFGASVDWLFGEYAPEFRDYQDGQIVRLDTSLVDTIATPLGNIDVTKADIEQYRMKAFMKVSF